MSIFSSLYIGMSGMRVNETGFAVVGDNIANMNTIGFKASRANFADVLNRTIIGQAGVAELGQGSVVNGVRRLHTQGALLQTGVETDLAIGGNGFFILEGEAAGGEGTFFTRNGQFRLNDAGFLVNNAGLLVQGFAADQTGTLDTVLGSLLLGTQVSPPEATTNVNLQVNLDPSSEELGGFDATDIEGTVNFTSTISVFDSLGESHDVDVFFSKTGPNTWQWNAIVEGTPFSGDLTFDESGVLIAPDPPEFTLSGVIFPGAAPQDIVLDFEDTTQVAKESSVLFIDADGRPPGDLAFLTVEPDGTIQGAFSNGDTRVLGQLALATFQAPDDLDNVGGNLFKLGPGAGEAAIGTPNSGLRGQVFAGALEQANVDLTNEFTQMITTQRGFQASSRTISTANQMLGELVNLNR